MPTAVETEELTVEHVREPGEGKPVSVVEGGESPDDAGPRETAEYLRVFRDVDGVVEAYECVAPHLEIHGENGDEETEANPEIWARVEERTRILLWRRWFAAVLLWACQSGFPLDLENGADMHTFRPFAPA
jgi:hypothetical protein